MKNEESRRKPILQSLQQDFARRENTLQSLQSLSRVARTFCNRCKAFRVPRERLTITAKSFRASRERHAIAAKPFRASRNAVAKWQEPDGKFFILPSLLLKQAPDESQRLIFVFTVFKNTEYRISVTV